MKKIGEIKGVPVVEGNVNEVTRNQIHYKEDSGSIQLSKRGDDNKLNSVTGSSSSGDGGLKEYYYKIIGTQDYNTILHTFFTLFGSMDSIIIWNDNNVEINCYYALTITKIRTHIGYFKVIDSPCNIPWINEDTYIIEGITFSKGNLYERFAKLSNIDIETATSQLSSIIQEITKEEYESMITYRPE